MSLRLIPKTLSSTSRVGRCLLRLSVAALLACAMAVPIAAQSPVRTIHVFVALADNKNQGIVPVAAILGNGEDPVHNLYWGSAYGVKTFLSRSGDWELLPTLPKPRSEVLERCVFKHKSQNVYLIADAYQGNQIQQAIIDFLEAAAGVNAEKITVAVASQKLILDGRGGANLVAYVGHEGFMDFQLSTLPQKKDQNQHDAIILACISKSYFALAHRRRISPGVDNRADGTGSLYAERRDRWLDTEGKQCSNPRTRGGGLQQVPKMQPERGPETS